MICYQTLMGPQKCSVIDGGVICPSTKQLMSCTASSSETVNLGYVHRPSSSSSVNTTTTRILNQTNTKHLGDPEQVGTTSPNNPFTFLSITVESSSSPSPESLTTAPQNPSTALSVISPPGRKRHNHSLHFDTLWTRCHQYPDEAKDYFVKGGEPDHCFELPLKLQKRLYYKTVCTAEGIKYNPDCLSRSENSIRKDDTCMPELCGRMNKGDKRDELWQKDDTVKDAKTQNKTTTTTIIHEPADEPSTSTTALESVISVGNTSEEGQVESGDTNIDIADSIVEDRGNESSSFLFIGPVGKKRRCCRERRASDNEAEILSPASVPATPDPTFTPDPPPLVEDISEDSSRSRGSGSSREGVLDEVVPTRTSVIRSVPRKQGDDQPLNLSLPVDFPIPPTLSPSSSIYVRRDHHRLRGESVGDVGERVSVINIVPRERLVEEDNVDLSPTGSESPYLLQHSTDLPELGYGHRDDGNGQLSPGPSASTSTDFFAISPGSALALSPGSGGPSSFQGLLLAQGILGQNNGSSSQKKKLKCRDCGKEFSQLRNYKYHRSRHEGTQQFACTCPVCGKTFNDKGYLSSHLKIHRNEKEYKCEWCGKSFNQRVAYNMHIRIHTGHKPHKCSYCTKAFSRKMLLRQHVRTHTGERPYKCAICGKAFADRSNMLLHQRLHSGERPYKCHICGKSFSKNHHLKTHLNHHAGIKPYQCDKCRACFSQSSNMKTHFRKCTGIPSATATITSETFERTASRRSSTTGMSPIIPQNLSPYSMEEQLQEAALLEEQLQHQQRLRQLQHEQFIGLSPMQQQQILSEMGASFGLSGHPGIVPPPLQSPTALPSPRSSGYHRSSFGQQSAASPTSQSLGFNLSSMSLSSPPSGLSRSRRPSMSHIPLSNPSPTSLAAGHPFIPLENLGATGTPSPHLSPTSPSNLLLMSPRHQTTPIRNLSPSEYSQMQSFSQTISMQQRSLATRSRLMPQTVVSPPEQQQQSQMEQHGHGEMQSHTSPRTHHHQLSPHQIPIPRISPGRPLQLSPRQSHAQQAQEYYEVILPALAISRSMSQLSPRQLRAEMLNEQQHQQQIGGMRQPELQRIYRVQNPRPDPGRSQFHASQQQQGLLALSGDLHPSSTQNRGMLPSITSLTRNNIPTSHNSQETFRDSIPGSLEQRLREAQQEAWRQARNSGNNNDKSPYKDGQYRQ